MPYDKIPATPEDLLSPQPDIPHEDCGDARRVPKERIVMDKKNYCNDKGECTALSMFAPCSDCKYYKEGKDSRCKWMDWYDGPLCSELVANKEARAK